MKWLSSLFKKDAPNSPPVKADALSDIRHPTAWLLDWSRGGPTLAGTSVNHQSALALPAYYACIRAISEDIGKVPLITYRRLKPRGKERAYDHSLYPILHDFPNDEMESLTFRETLTAHALSWGNGYAEIEHDSRGNVVALYPIHPSRVLVRRDQEGRLVYDISGTQMIPGTAHPQMVRLRAENVFHLRGIGAEGLIGYSVVQIARESLGLSIATQQFGAAFFGNGAHIGGVLEHPQVLSDIAAKHLRESWKDMYVGPEKVGTPAILEEGMKWNKIGIPPNDAQFLETRTFQVREVARWFRMPLHKIQDMADASYANIEQMTLGYVTDTLMPWFVRWEQQIKRKLFVGEDEYFAEHLLLGMLRGDQGTRSSYYRTMFGLGTLSPNDIREMENMNPIGPRGDEYYYAGNNLIPLGQSIMGNTSPAGDETEAQDALEHIDPWEDDTQISPYPSRNGTQKHV